MLKELMQFIYSIFQLFLQKLVDSLSLVIDNLIILKEARVEFSYLPTVNDARLFASIMEIDHLTQITHYNLLEKIMN